MALLDNRVRVFRTRPEVKIPVRAHRTDAGMDFFFSPVEGVAVRIQPGESVLLETGIKMEIPSNCMLQIMNKSSVASKMHLITGACVVDEGYTGEIFVNLHNIGKDTEFIEPGQKIAQGVFVRIEKPVLYEIDTDSVYDIKTARGEGSLGSTGNK
jgi:dUTP pyrophosphatase